MKSLRHLSESNYDDVVDLYLKSFNAESIAFV
jgi:hypothetical protein